MKTSLVNFILAALVLLSVFGCERKSVDVGGEKVAKNTPSLRPSELQATLSHTPGEVHIVDVSAGKPQALNGKTLFEANCSACHQVTGQGIPGAFPPLDGSEWVNDADSSKMASIMVYGLMGPIHVKGVEYNSVMAPLGHLKNEELAAIASYVRGAWSNKAAEVSPQVFLDVRAKWGARGPLTEPELLAAK